MQRVNVKTIKLGLILFLTLAAKEIWSQSRCNRCSLWNGLACVSQTQFQVCDANNLPTGAATSCPFGYVCSTIDPVICRVSSDIAFTDSVDCNRCDSTNTFACIGPRTYALCLGVEAPSQLTGSCAPDLVCSIDTPTICGNPLLGAAATCSFYDNSTSPTTTTPTTATPTIPDPNSFCSQMAQLGRFPVGNNITSTCHQYYYCFLKGGIWYGNKYTCLNGYFFNSNTRYCDKDPESRCTATAATLRFNSLP